MIKAVIVINTLGKPRLSKFYEFQRRSNRSSYAMSTQDTRLVYKHYATLYFVFLFDNSENELAMLDLIQVFVETLDKCFKSVCELDVVFNYSKMHAILDEIILGGQVLETDSAEVMRAVEEISKLESTTSAGTLINKSIPSWWAR